MIIAAIDIGSNSIKMVVVDAAASDSFAVLAREKETVRLGRGTLREGHLARETIERAADCIKRFRSIAEMRGAERVVAVATASVREADNAPEFIEEVLEQAGVRVELLSGVEEARLIGIAAAQGCAEPGASLLNIDIGGGSTEFSLVRDGMPSVLYSVNLGAVGLTERFVSSDPVKAKELRALRDEIRAALERPSRELRGETWQQATGTSGTIIALGAFLRARGGGSKAQAAQPTGAEVALNALSRFNDEVTGMDSAERRRLPGISAQRAEILVAGGQILEGSMRALGVKQLRTCDYALREGVVIDRLREMEAASRPPVPDVADPRLLGVHAVGRRFGYEESHALHVALLSERIFDALAPTTGLTRHQRTLLSAAALLHDVGYHIAHEAHHKHSLYLVKHSELTGFSEAERDVIANITRYHRGGLPKERHAEYTALNRADRATVDRLGGILRVADALDIGHESRVEDITCEREGRSVRVELRSAFDCEKEIWAAERKGDLFEQSFECKLAFSQATHTGD
ncbi:MAG TPA: Ppx/GppA phosphatase family protein [Pyrinomonadaceae bacterium]|nr:Ppx/GppA phosphatase family protein [Pyrinomonadaceae bacterium]